MKKLKIFLKNYPLEGYIWIASLVALALINTDSDHFTLCPFYNLGMDFCPGCGLGQSVHHIVNLNFKESIIAHPLGGAAVIIFLYRIFSLTKSSMHKIKTNISY